MLDFLIIITIFALGVFFIYAPAIVQYFVWKKSEREFRKELQTLENSGLYDQCRVVITEPLGVDIEPNGKISFAEAMQHQEFAMNSIMKLMS